MFIQKRDFCEKQQFGFGNSADIWRSSFANVF